MSVSGLLLLAGKPCLLEKSGALAEKLEIVRRVWDGVDRVALEYVGVRLQFLRVLNLMRGERQAE